MAHLIDKDAVLAEIDRLACQEYNSFCDKLLDYIDTLEVKGVDLEKEIEQYVSDKGLRDYGFLIPSIAKHFFELGLKAQKL